MRKGFMGLAAVAAGFWGSASAQPQNCVSHYYVVDSLGRCVGDVVGSPDYTVVARHLPPCEAGVCLPSFGSSSKRPERP
jgi:hypothetical protein